MSPGRLLLDRRQGGAPLMDVAVRPAPTLTSQSVGAGQWVITLDGVRVH